MKKYIKLSVMLFVLALSFTSCEDNTDLEFVAAPQGDFAFTNTFLTEYILPADATTDGNIGAVFAFNSADFGVPTNVSYELQSSVIGDFTDAALVSTLSNGNNQMEVSVGTLKTLAEEYGIVAPNSGNLNFRVRAFPGDSGSTTEVFSPTQVLSVTLLEAASGGGPNCPSIWVVGAGAVDAGWGWDSPVEFTCTDDVYTANINLINDAFRFFLTEGDWGSGQNYPYYVSEGYTIDANFEDAMDGDNNFRFTGTPGEYSLTVDTVNKVISLEAADLGGAGNCDSRWVVGAGAIDAGWGWDSPVEFICTDNVFRANISLINDAFRFFLTEGDWGSGQNFPYYVGEGYTIDPLLEDAMDGDNNFRFTGTPGYYLLTVDTVNKTITLEPPGQDTPNCDSVWVVGAGAADAGWAWDTPIEFTCTDNSYGTYINLTNDSFRFFLTEGDWGSGQNYPYYINEGFTIDSRLEDAMDGDNNFSFTGTPGNYYLRVDTVNKTIILQ